MNGNDPVITYLMGLVGKPYIWGGTGAVGFDCSGLVVEMLKARGFVKARYDATSQTLFEKTASGGTLNATTHCLSFYGKPGRISHVGYCINSEQMVEAGGGNSRCKTPEDAEKYGAYVRLRPIHYRKDFISIHMPSKDHFTR